MYCGRLDARGTLSRLSPGVLPLALCSWLIVIVGSSVASPAIKHGRGVDGVMKNSRWGD